MTGLLSMRCEKGAIPSSTMRSCAKTPSSLSRMLFAAILLQCANVIAPAQTDPQDLRIDDETYRTLVERMQPPSIPDLEIDPIQSAMERKDWGKARSLINELLERPISEFPTEFYGYRLKASAHYLKYRLILENGGSYIAAFREQIAAIRNGSPDAAEEVSLHFLQGDDPRVRPAAGSLSEKEFEELLRAGAELGDEFSEAALGIARVADAVPADERLYWALLTIVRDKTKQPREKRAMLDGLIGRMGSQAVSDLLKKYSIVGGSLPASDIGLPSRGLIETLFVEGDLRGTYGRAKATVIPSGMKAPLAPTVRENFDFYSRIVPEVGFGDAYILVPLSGTPPQSRMILAEKAKIISELEPGDRVFVSCGPLAHVTILYRRDRNSRKLLFVDPLYEFWVPSVNTCVSKFDLVEDRNRRFLTAIGEEDVAEMLQAVITVRDAR
jgi:hypothetical protein